MVVCLLLCSKELREGGKILVEKLKKFRPLIAVFNGKCKRSSPAPLVGLGPHLGPAPPPDSH